MDGQKGKLYKLRSDGCYCMKIRHFVFVWPGKSQGILKSEACGNQSQGANKCNKCSHMHCYNGYVVLIGSATSLQNCFTFINLLIFLITTAKIIILLAIFINFLWICEVRKISPFPWLWLSSSEERGEWACDSSKDQQLFPSKKNVWEHAKVWFRLVPECKEDVFSKGFAIQDAQKRAIIFIQYHIPITLIHNQEKAKSSVQSCGKSNIEQFFNLGVATTVKTHDFQGLYILPWLLAQSLLFSRQMRHKWLK